MQITRNEIEDIIMTMASNDILFVGASTPLIFNKNKIPTKYDRSFYELNEILSCHIVNILCAEYEISA